MGHSVEQQPALSHLPTKLVAFCLPPLFVRHSMPAPHRLLEALDITLSHCLADLRFDA